MSRKPVRSLAGRSRPTSVDDEVAAVKNRVAALRTKPARSGSATKPDPLVRYFMGKEQRHPADSVESSAMHNAGIDCSHAATSSESKVVPARSTVISSHSRRTVHCPPQGVTSSASSEAKVIPARSTVISSHSRRTVHCPPQGVTAHPPPCSPAQRNSSKPLSPIRRSRSLAGSIDPLSPPSAVPEQSARVTIRISASAVAKWDYFDFRGDINLTETACGPRGASGVSKSPSVHAKLLKGLANALKISEQGLRLANFAYKEGTAPRGDVLITVFFDAIVRNGVLTALQQNLSRKPNSSLKLGDVGDCATVVSIDLGASTIPPDDASPKNTARSLGQGFLFGIINEEGANHFVVAS